MLGLTKGLIIAAALLVLAGLIFVSFELSQRNERISTLEARVKELKTNRSDALKEVENLKAKLALLESELSRRKAEPKEDPPDPAVNNPEKNITNADETAAKAETAPLEAKVSARISAISKFVPLTDEQRRRLKEKFEQEAVSPDRAHAGESLEDILGAENAAFYKEQRKLAFEKAFQESLEKEVLYISRKLGLTTEQEERVRSIFSLVEKEVKEISSQSGGITTLERLILEEKERSRLLLEHMREVLSPAQYDEFMKRQNNSQDMQVWHE